MAESKRGSDQRTERTAKGYEVPVPKRREFFSNLRKIARKDSGGSAKK
jgi:hypothetical protein